jgi:putative MFS transporter
VTVSGLENNPTYRDPRAFWVGLVAVSAGVALHLPMYWSAWRMGSPMSGQSMSPLMHLGMALIVAGLACAIYGAVPRRSRKPSSSSAVLEVRALDTVPLSRAHLMLAAVMSMAVTIDVMKPTTLAFVIPGMTREYNLKSPLNPAGAVPAAWLPLFALTGMAVGALLWGLFGDVVGRRSSILLAGIVFIATSVCGAMPTFGWNLIMCFSMGLAVGGMLPVAFTLLAECFPTRHRGWLMVLIGGDVAGAYVITSFLASVLEPQFGWRILWLIGLPTGLVLLLLNRWIPESPRFLIAHGCTQEAEAVLHRFGGTVVFTELEAPGVGAALPYRHLFSRRLLGRTTALILLGLSWGLINNGFLLWLPTNLRAAGMDAGRVDRLLAESALLGFPAVFLVAVLYGFWSSKATIIGATAVDAVALVAFASAGWSIKEHPVLVQLLLATLLLSTSALLAMLTPYSAEVYPTAIRARGVGVVGFSTRLGGLAAVAAVLMGATPELDVAALVGVTPLALGGVLILRHGVETRNRSLEEIRSPS